MSLDKRISIICHPEITYPEFPYAPTTSPSSLWTNLKALFKGLDLDSKNPLGHFIRPGNTVVIKPNWVMHIHPDGYSLDSLITHTSLIRYLIDFSLIALADTGRIIIADAPLQGCNFSRLLTVSRISELLDTYKKDHPRVKFDIIDLRKTLVNEPSTLTGDPAGYSLVNLGSDSLLTDISHHWNRFRVSMYDFRLMHRHHNQQKHEYLISNSVLQADAVINLAKMKCHLKSGLTGAMKNFVGINGHKEFLPHHVQGSFIEGGDQYIYPSLIKNIYNNIYDKYWSKRWHQPQFISFPQNLMMKLLMGLSLAIDADNLFDGGWFGNETIPRTTIDLNNILYFYDSRSRSLKDRPKRRVLNIVDGIIAGQHNGPLHPRPISAGTLIAGVDPLLVDLAMGYLMGYDVLAVKTLLYALYHQKSLFSRPDLQPETLPVIYNSRPQLLREIPIMNFIKPDYWQAVSRN